MTHDEVGEALQAALNGVGIESIMRHVLDVTDDDILDGLALIFGVHPEHLEAYYNKIKEKT